VPPPAPGLPALCVAQPLGADTPLTLVLPAALAGAVAPAAARGAGASAPALPLFLAILDGGGALIGASPLNATAGAGGAAATASFLWARAPAARGVEGAGAAAEAALYVV
jgi:hypothetical protein